MTKPFVFEEDWGERIAESLTGLKYGSVEIIVHDGRIVQIERMERVRFDARNQDPTSRHSQKRRKSVE